MRAASGGRRSDSDGCSLLLAGFANVRYIIHVPSQYPVSRPYVFLRPYGKHTRPKQGNTAICVRTAVRQLSATPSRGKHIRYGTGTRLLGLKLTPITVSTNLFPCWFSATHKNPMAYFSIGIFSLEPTLLETNFADRATGFAQTILTLSGNIQKF